MSIMFNEIYIYIKQGLALNKPSRVNIKIVTIKNNT